MRPARRILIFDADEEMLGVWRHVTLSKRYLPWTASRLEEVKRILQDPGDQPDVAIICHTNMFGPSSRRAFEVGKWMAENHPEIPMVSVVSKQQTLTYCANAICREPANTMAHIWDAVRRLAARKRGPKPRNEPVTA